MNNLILPACHAGAFYASSTPFLGRLGRAVAVREILGGATPDWAGLIITELSALEKT